MSVPEMRVLKWICGKTRNDNIQNEQIRETVKVRPNERKIAYIRWCEFIQRRRLSARVPKRDSINIRPRWYELTYDIDD